MPKDTRNVRALAVAYRLQDVTAATITAGIANLQSQQHAASFGPPIGERGDRHGKGGHSDPTADVVAERYRLGLMLEDVRDALEGVEIAAAHLARLADRACRTRAFGADASTPAAESVKRCGENQRSTDTRKAPDGVIEWGRQECSELPAKAGLCHACYMRRYRWAQANDQPMDDLDQGALL